MIRKSSVCNSQFMELFGAIDDEREFPRKQWNEVLRIVNGRDHKPISDPQGAYLNWQKVMSACSKLEILLKKENLRPST